MHSYFYKIIALFFLLLTFLSKQYAQELKQTVPVTASNNYDTDVLPPSFHKKNREKLRELMSEGSIAIFFSSPIKNRSNDVDYEFHQNPNFYYLTGIREPNAVLIIFKEPQWVDTSKVTEIVYLEETNPAKQIWTGPTIGTIQTVEKYKLQAAKSNKFFENNGFPWASYKNIYIDKLHTAEANSDNKQSTYYLQKQLTSFLENNKLIYNTYKLNEFMSAMRQIKSKEETAMLQKACDITCNGFLELIKMLEPGLKEYQTEAIMEYFFKTQGAEFEGYPSICGGAENSTVLHYSTNRRNLNDGDLLVVDAGAEYRGYTADITRTLPVNGKFTNEQKIIYNIVLEAQLAGIAACKPGANFWDSHSAASTVIKKRLLELGIIKNDLEFLKYFMHGTSHYLGLDVHDCGLYQKLEPGMVLTVEPGIYIREGSECDPKWWNIGVRIEDDILITEKGNKVLSDKAPKTIEDIEALMKEESLLNKLSK